MHPRLSELIAVCLAEKVGHIVLAGGIPPRTAMRQVKDGGATLICFAPALVLAKKLVRDGADGLVIEGAEAGGHVGPVATSVLAQEILPVIREARLLCPERAPRVAGLREIWPPRVCSPGFPAASNFSPR